MGKHEAPRAGNRPAQRRHRAEPEKKSFDLKLPEISFSKLSQLPKPDWTRLREGLESIAKIGVTPGKSGAAAHQRSYAFNKLHVLLTAGAALLFFLLWLLPTSGTLRFLLYLIPLFLLGFYTVLDALGELLDRKITGRNLLICVSVLGLLILKQPRAAVFVMLIHRVMLLLEAYLFEKRETMREQIQSMIPAAAVVETEGGLEQRDSKSILPDEVVFVPANEIIPLDGIVMDGVSCVDASALTGTPTTLDVAENSHVYAGCKNLNKPLKIRVTAAYEDSAVSRMVRRVKIASASVSGRSARVEKLLDYLPLFFSVLALILMLVVGIATRQYRLWFYRGLILLVMTAMGDMLLSNRMAYFTGFFNAAQEGILFRDADVVDCFAGTDMMAFSKTGTITEGRYTVAAIYPVDYEERDLLTIAALAECQSTHPIARALREACGIEMHHRSDITMLEETPGRGIHTLFGGRNVYVGNSSLLIDHSIAFDVPSHKGTVVHVAIDNRYAGCIVLNDRMRDNAFDAIEELRVLGLRAAVMLTGDVQSMARPLASSLNFDIVKCELSNEAKIDSLRYLRQSKGNSAPISYVSSKREDHPLLQEAEVGIAFAALTDEQAMDDASIQVMSGNLRSLSKALLLAKRISFAALLDMAITLGSSAVLLVLGLTGVISIWLVALLCLLIRVGTLVHAIYFK